MEDIEFHKTEEWNFATAKGASGRFCAWGKMGPILGDSPISEPGVHVFFEYGTTRKEALSRLKDSLGMIR